jgi:hypothetical protein
MFFLLQPAGWVGSGINRDALGACACISYTCRVVWELGGISCSSNSITAVVDYDHGATVTVSAVHSTCNNISELSETHALLFISA